MASTAEITETPKAQREVVFMARRRALTLVRRPERVRYADATGEKIVMPGERFSFQNGRLATTDPDLIQWLRDHELFGNSESGFFEVTPQVPEPVEELQRIAIAAATANSEVIQEVLDAEREGWQRQVVIESCEFALTTLEQAAAQAPPPAE